MLGVARNKVALAPHDDAWASEYRLAADQLMGIIGDNIIEIHHVGSTAIKGIAAKPILDIAIVIKNVEILNVSGMEAAGYEYRGDAGVPGRHFFVRRVNGEISTHHVHCYLEGNDNYESLVLFAGFLNANPEYARQYNDLKLELARQFPDDRGAYGEAKTAFIEKVAVLARAEECNKLCKRQA